MPVDAVYGEPLDGVEVVDVPADLSVVFAAAHERVTGQPAGAHPGDGVVLGKATTILRPAANVDQALDALHPAQRPVVLAGPGVVPHVEGLRALAAAGWLGVLNTWGAKGVFDWRSPHHLATAGLQARDFELGGLADADLIVATGLDDAEAPADWRLAPVVEVDPAALAAIAARWGRDEREIPVPPLRTELARVTQEGWSRDSTPLAPSRVTLHCSEALGPDGLVVAEPGVAGYWVARTYPTSRLGGAIVPAEIDRPGFAAACAVVSRLVDPDRPVLLALDGHDASDDSDGAPSGLGHPRLGDPEGSRRDAGHDVPALGDRDGGRSDLGYRTSHPGDGESGASEAGHGAGSSDRDRGANGAGHEAGSSDRDRGANGAGLGIEPTVARVLEAGQSLGVTLAVEVWRADGDAIAAPEHAARLRRLLATGGVVTLATDPGQLDDMVAVAGPVVAWGGLDSQAAGREGS